MNIENKKRYDEKPYISKAYSFSQPFKQNIALKLMGLKGSDLKNARILEIGCSYGGNIISQALYYENTEIIGIDLSDVQVSAGNKIIEEIGLKNIKLYNMDIMDYNYEFGKFDYIICHGVYSWVNDSVKDKILKTIKNSLKENGSAVVSYNTYPGWRNFDIIKDIMKFRVKMLKKAGIETNSKNEVSYGRGCLDFIKEYASNNKEIISYIDMIYDKSDYYIYHDFLEENNDPLYVYDFNKQLLENGLIHVSDTNLSISNRIISDGKLLESIENECGNDNVAKEQYYDLIFNTSFRYSLITQIENKEKISKLGNFQKDILNEFYINGKFNKNEEGKYVIKNGILNEEYTLFADKINQLYPNTLKVEDVIKEYGEDYYFVVLNLIINQNINLLDFPININKDLKKIKLNKKMERFLNVVLENYDKVSFSDKFAINYSKDELEILKEFVSGKSFEEIYNEIKSNYNSELFDEVFENIYYQILISEQYEVID